MEGSQNPHSSNDDDNSRQPQYVPASSRNPQAVEYLQNLPAYVHPTGGPVSLPAETYNYLVQNLTTLQASSDISRPLPYGSHQLDQVAFSDPWSPYQHQSDLSPSFDEPSGSSSSALSPSPESSRAGSAGGHDSDAQRNDERDTEEKRRANNSASARSRLKKKQETLRLERMVSDLTGRFEELEREAADLRKENGLLKELALLKGKILAETGESSPVVDPDEPGSSDEDESGDEQGLDGGSIKGGKGKGKSVS